MSNQTLTGGYEIVKILGTGKMGIVYACRHAEKGDQLFAMKILFPELTEDAVASARFRHEIVATMKVSHPNVVKAVDYILQEDVAALVMEYVGGDSLASRLSKLQVLPLDWTVHILAQICSGLGAIHAAGIVHRDLKPQNILLTPAGDVKIADFGLARLSEGPRLTKHGGIVGSMHYASPEYLERGVFDSRSDIFAVGILGYEMVTGRSPFGGGTAIQAVTKRLQEDPPPPDQLRPECPALLRDCIMKALKRNPQVRFQNAAEMENMLKQVTLEISVH